MTAHKLAKKLTKKLTLTLAFLLFSLSTFTIAQSSETLESFEKRFHLVKNNEGRVTIIKDRSISASFSIRPYIEFIKNALKNEQKMMNNKSLSYESDVRSLLMGSEKSVSTFENDNIELTIRSLFELDKLDIDGIFNHPKFKEVISAFEIKLGDLLNYVDPRVVANLDDSRFFYNKIVTYQAVSFALNFAKRRLSTIPLLNTASYVITQVERLVNERRTFHQNMLLHYFERFSENELGMTKQEVDHAYSSIYESRISWFAFWESSAARAAWDTFGVSRFFAEFRMGTNRLRLERNLYQNLGERVNYAFQEVEQNGKKYIVNLKQNEAMFQNRSAIAFDMENPARIARKRTILQLANLGLSFVPVSQFIKDIGHSYLKSHYEAQRLTEGALFAHFEAHKMERERRIMMLQYMNPFDTSLLKF